jgi:hypothetical protein
LVDASLWGLAGGAVAALLSLSAGVVAADFTWPWRDKADGVWPHLFVAAVALLVGAAVSGAASAEITGPWPALIMGASAPAVIRNALAKIEVSESKPATEAGDDLAS